MSYNGTGTFSINSAGQPVVTGTTITSTAFNTLTTDLATGLSTALCKDGQSTPTANLGLGAFKITNLGAGTLATDAARLSQIQSGAATFVVASGTDTILGTGTPALTAYATGNAFQFTVASTNTAAVTLNIDSLGAKAVTRDGSTALVAGDLVSGSVVTVVYDGTRFQVLNSNSKTNWNLSGTLTAASTATATKFIPTGTSVTGNGMYLPAANALGFSTNGTEAMRITAAGKVGIGVTGPNALLSVSVPIATATSISDGMRVNETTGGYGVNIGAASTYGWIQGLLGLTSTTSSNALILQPDAGSVGIGTTSPSARLSVDSGATALVTNFNSTNASGGYVRFQNSGTSIGDVGSGANLFSGGTAGDFGATSRSGNLVLGSNSTERMRISSTGAVSIAAPTSGTPLTVNGIAATNMTYINCIGATTGSIQFNMQNTGGQCILGVDNSAGNSILDTAYAFCMNAVGARSIVFGTNNTSRMRIDSSGNVGIGTASPSTLFHVVGVGKFSGTTNRGLYVDYSGNGNIGIDVNYSSASGTASQIYFNYNGTNVGQVQSGVSSTSYLTTSDYRRKNVVGAVSGSGARIDALKPIDFEWKVDKSQARGFLAHEFQEVYPNSVSGTKDGTKEEEYEVTPAVEATQDADGVELTPAEPAVKGTRTVPDYQAMQASTSEVIADLVAELQSLRKRIATLEFK